MTTLCGEIRALASGQARFLLGIAGPPASGKSTLASKLVDAMPEAALLPMDGFHLDDKVLDANGWRSRKGAPHTFDVGGFVSLLGRVRAGEDVYAPEFDRDLELSRGSALAINAPMVIVEGNYLLFESDGWDAVRPLLDACWFLDVSEMELVRRLRHRWADRVDAEAWIENNDLPNIRAVRESRFRADRLLSP
ncbi:nucleoside/nucleotide kinase family protein [Algicella marina]|uniref:Nucleoside/nucleotide kinase family protein n=1 Tax=Algicella marina TaxID=2683284 RepID=A0A6P1T9X3_9RHOB|nr:nucleoside/nucleotide kinase family protein [Algicella marina]